MKNVGRFLVLMCILSTVPAYAQSDLTLFGAVQHEGKLTVKSATTTATTTSTFDPGTFGTFGVRFGHGRVFGGEHSFAYSSNFVEAASKAILYNSNVLVQAPVPKIKPYATAGLGTIITWGTDPSGRPSFGKIGTKFAINYGGGVKVLPAGPVGVRFDIRGYAIPSVHFNIPTSPTATVQSQSQTLNLLEAGFGVIFSFGR
jgi:opacity protein-like surface antigen